MSADGVLEFRGLAGQLSEQPFDPVELGSGVVDRLARERHGWLTTVSESGAPLPMPVWFHFDGSRVIVYSQPRAIRIAHISEHPDVALHLDSDGLGGGIVVIGGKAAVTATGLDPRADRSFWAKYHVEAQACGLADEIASYTVRITITPTTVWTTLPA